MRAELACIFAAVAMSASVIACGSESRSCTAELRGAVTVEVVDGSGAAIEADAVTREKDGRTAECERFDERYVCHEAGGGIYEITVVVGDESQIQSTSIAADDCHTTEQKTVTFTF